MASAGTLNEMHISEDQSSQIQTSLIVVVFVASLFLLVENLLTIVSVLFFTKKKNTFSLLLIALSLTEVLNVLGPNAIALFVSLDETREFRDLFTLCRVQAWMIVFLRMAATLIITLLALDRAFVTVFPRFYRRQWNGKLFVVFFFGIWVVASFAATWPLLWLDGFHVSKETQNMFCLFEYENPFAGFFVLFLFFSSVVCSFCFCSIFSTANRKSFSTQRALDEDLGSSKQNDIVGRDIHSDTKELSRIAALVVAIYFCCILPWMVAVTLGVFSVDYPSLFGVCAIQIPKLSGLLNPLIYGITWSPYRRAYIRALKWPGAECCKRKLKRSSRARSHNLNSSISASHSFWISDSFDEEDADHENAFHILFGPTSYIKPLDFNPEELEMFEQCVKNNNEETRRFSKLKRSLPDHAPDKGTKCHVHGNHFQDILDFIDEMTDGKRQNIGKRENLYATEFKRDTSKASRRAQMNKGGIAPNQSAYKTRSLIGRHGADHDISFISLEIPGLKQCKGHKMGEGCSCLGKSKCYIVHKKLQEVDSLVSQERENFSSGETLSSNAASSARFLSINDQGLHG